VQASLPAAGPIEKTERGHSVKSDAEQSYIMNVREWALPVYTILMQLAIGALLVLWIIRWLASPKFSPGDMDRIIRNPILVIFFTVIAAMIGSQFHLSKPYHSFFAVLNFRTSWLSREVVFTVLFFLALGSVWLVSRYKQNHRKPITALGWTAILLGSIVVYFMARIYLIPTQVAWNSSTVIISFYTTTLLLGTMAIACLLVLDLKFAEIQKAEDIEVRAQVIQYSMTWLSLVIFLMVAINFVVIFYQVYQLSQGGAVAQTSLQLLLELYIPLFIMRLTVLGIAPFWFGFAVYRMRKAGLPPQDLMTPVYMSCLLILVGEIIGRFLFYATHIRLGI
jgi:anaerobic dimethyl sulfoxide reductase subunit C (anchor subunit)